MQKDVKIRIACRSAVWPNSVFDALINIYENDAICVLLEGFNIEDVHAIIRSHGIDADLFMERLTEVGVQELAQNPVTLKMLLGEFRPGDKLSGSRRELFDKAILRLCREPDIRLERGTSREIPPERIEDTSRYLATVMMFSGRASVNPSSESVVSENCLTLDELESLPKYRSVALSRELLRQISSFGLFERDGEKSFKFAHRQFAEFLAGKTIASLPFHQARSMLGGGLGWSNGVAGPLQETAASAAAFDSKIAEWIAETDPEIIGKSDIGDMEIRRVAARKMLELFRKGKYTSANLYHDRLSFAGFIYPGASADLRIALEERGDPIDDYHACAIRMVEQFRLDELSNRLADMTLDDNLPVVTRVHAGHALNEMGDEREKHRLKSLVRGCPEDEDDDLKGISLSCNWPDNLSTEELLEALSKPKRNNYVGAYSSFLFRLQMEGFDSGGNLARGVKEEPHYFGKLSRDLQGK